MPQYTYKFTFKKGDIFVEYTTTDKESIARQFQIWVTCASIYTYNREKFQQQEQQEAERIVKIEPLRVEPAIIEELPSKTLDKEQLEEMKQEIAEVIEQVGEVSDNLDNLYSDKVTINELNAPDEAVEAAVEEFTANTDDFDLILEKSLNNSTFEPEQKRDDRFMKILSVKNVQNKLEYLIVTAYYLSEFEKLDKFTLKLINAKLMQNIGEAVDHTILQEAIDKNLVEILPNLPEIQSSAEYRLTTAGEEAFLNGMKL